MVRPQFFRICLGLLLATCLAGGSPAILNRPQVSQGDLTVSAAISLKDSLDEIGQLYRARRPEQIVRFNFGGSGTLLLQIEQNAPVDMFISASPEEMNKLASRSLLLQGTRRDLLRNQIVLIVPQGKKVVTSFEDLAKPEIRFIAVGEPQTVPAGKYAQEVLTHLGLYDRLKPKFVMGSDVRQVLTYVSTGNADAGIVYATDAQISQQVRVVMTAPEDSHSPVIYPVAIIKASKNPVAARDFERFLIDPQVRAVFQKHGFMPINP